jgi:uncharacterized membrane protein YdbT with pleckstrin-like domain
MEHENSNTPESTESPTQAEESDQERLKNDRPSQRGLPPDFGTEQAVMKIRPSFFRAKPIRVLILLAMPLIAAAVATWLVEEGSGFGRGAVVLGIAAVVCWVPMAVWWFIATRSKGLEITNKRTIERRGLLSKSTDEVLHDHVRNVKVDQSFYDRIVRIGQIGIASSGSDQTEIIMEDLPDPQKIREIIDLYRPLD